MIGKKSKSLLWLLPLVAQVFSWKHVTETQLREALREKEYTLVAFTFAESDASQALAPEWEAVQKAAKDPNMLSLDCAISPELCRELDIASYPAIRLYHRDGKMVRHRGERRADQILAFLSRAKQSSTTLKEIPSSKAKEIPSLLKSDDVVFLAHIGPHDTDLRAEFASLAARYHDVYTFAVTTGHAQSAVRCVNNVDEEEHAITATDLAAEVGALERFVRRCAAPLIPELTRRNEVEYSRTGKSLLHYFFTTQPEKDSYRKEMRPLAKKYAEFLHFTLNDANEYPEMVTFMGLEAGSKTGLSLQNPNTGDVFPYRQKTKKRITPAMVERFLEDVIDGKVRPLGGRKDGGRDEL